MGNGQPLSAFVDGTLGMVECIFDGTNHWLAKDGIYGGTTAAAAIALNATRCSMGGPCEGTVTVECWKGVYAKVFVFDYVPTLVDRQKLHGYAMHKVGLQAQLRNTNGDDTHPYKSAPPT